MNETLDKTTDYGTHLETYRCLDLLIKMLENLYPNINNKQGEKTVSLKLYQHLLQKLESGQAENINLLKRIEELEHNQTERDQHHVSES